MDKIKIVKDIFDAESTITISEINLSYIEQLLPDLRNHKCIVFHEEVPFKKKDRCHEADETSCKADFDVTGSPLKYSFKVDDLQDSIVETQKYWQKAEERYIPLSREKACNCLNICLLRTSHDCDDVLSLAICDAKDVDATTALGVVVENGWFTRIEIKNMGAHTLGTIESSFPTLMQNHLKLSSMQAHNVTTSVLYTYNLFGRNREGSVKVEISSRTLSFMPSLKTMQYNLFLQIITSSNNTPLAGLWHQLLLLEQYLAMMEDFKEQNLNIPLNILQFLNDHPNLYTQDREQITEKLNLLINDEQSYRRINNIDLQKIYYNDDEDSIKLEKYITDMFNRFDLDFTDLLWNLLMCTLNFKEITHYMKMIFQEILINKYRPQISGTNTTRFTKIISNLSPDKYFIPHFLTGSLPLEILIDIGFEKLIKDYIYILLNAKLIDLCKIKEKLNNISSEEFNLDLYRKKLIFIAQIHICLEFMVLAQTHLDCSTKDLQILFKYVFNEYVPKELTKPLHELLQNKAYATTIPISHIFVTALKEQIPSSWNIDLSSQTKLLKWTTSTYYSKIPVFPVNIYPTDNVHKGEQIFYSAAATSVSTRFNPIRD